MESELVKPCSISYKNYARKSLPYLYSNSDCLTLYKVKELSKYSIYDLIHIINDIEAILNNKISVVIPSYNRAFSIIPCLQSILAQTHSDYEIIVADDCSSDNTKELVKSLNASKIRFYKLEKNSGAQAARNIGIQKASGHYIAFLDSDDTWLENKLEIQYELLKDAGDNVFIWSDCFTIQEDGVKNYWNLSNQDDNFLKAPAPMFQGILTTKPALLHIGLLDERIISYQEWDTSIQLAKFCKIIHIKSPLYNYIFHSNETISKNGKREIQGYYNILKKYKVDIQNKNISWWNNHILNLIKRSKQLGFDDFSNNLYNEFIPKDKISYKTIDLLVKNNNKLTRAIIRRIMKRSIRKNS